MADAIRTDFAIIGGGAAGLSAAAYAARAGLDTTVLEAMGPGGQILVIDRIENYPGFGEGITGFELAQKFESQASQFGAKIEYSEVSEIKKDNKLFAITSSTGIYEAKAVLIATGAIHRPLGVPGEKEYAGHGVSYCATCDGPFFRGKKILVVGGGDSAVQEALYLSGLTDKLTIIHRRDRFRAQKKIVDSLLAKPSISVRLSTVLKEIKGDSKHVTSVVLQNTLTGEETEESFDAVFGFVGILPQTALATALGLDLDKSGYIITNQDMATSMPGVYAGGDVRSTPFRQVATACSDGAIAAHKAQEYIEGLEGCSYGEYTKH